MPSAEAPTSGRVSSKVASAFEPRDGSPLRARSSLRSSFSIAAEQVVERDPAVLEHDLGGVRGADAELRLLLALAQARACPSRPRTRPGRGGRARESTVATTTWTSAMPPLVMKTLVPLRTHSSPSRFAVVRRLLTSEPGLRLGDGVGAELDLVADAEALGHPAGDLLRRARRGEAGGGEAGARDRERDPGAAPVQLLGVDHADTGRRGREPIRCRCSSPCRPCSRASLITSQGVDSSASCLRRHRPDHVACEARASLPCSSSCSSFRAKSIRRPPAEFKNDRLTGQSTSREA